VTSLKDDNGVAAGVMMKTIFFALDSLQLRLWPQKTQSDPEKILRILIDQCQLK
jgi:hypothetical protein